MRVFGCACWPNLWPYNSHKLQPCSTQCIFLGYSLLHKGYKCLHFPSGHVYISRDVLFNEDVFPFAKICSTNLQSLSSLDFTFFLVQSSSGLQVVAPLSAGPSSSNSITQTSLTHTKTPLANTETCASPQLLAHPTPTLPYCESLLPHISLPPISLTNTTLVDRNPCPFLLSSKLNPLIP